MTVRAELGPLARLVGAWEGDEGLDVSYSNADGRILETQYRERATFAAFGPVANGEQSLHGLDFRRAAWRLGEADPFHTEVGYWLWDGPARQVMRCFVIPKGMAILAGGPSRADATAFTMEAAAGSETYGVCLNDYLRDAARAVGYRIRVDTGDAGVFTYDETTTVEHARCGRIEHTDKNRLLLVAE